jgi:cholesterol transport system auxiliary component
MRTTTIILMSLALLSGCGSLARPYPDKTLHAIHVGDPPAIASAQPPPGKMVLRVDHVALADPFDATTFVYQVGDSTFKSDYYNGFVAPPGRLLTGEVSAFLAKSGLFATVISGGSSADYQLSLESNVTSMYGDYRDGQKPSAVVSARFFIIDQTKGRFAVVFDKSYSQITPIEEKSVDGLVKAYNAGWTNLLTQLAGDLRSTSVVMNGP